jgi:hypothetical protein
MTKRTKMILGTILLVGVSGGLASWALGRSAASPKAPQTKYLTAFFEKYVAALNSHRGVLSATSSSSTPVCSGSAATAAFYAPDAVTVGAWGIEKNNAEREAYECGCNSAFPSASITVKSLKIEPATQTSGTITWEFGIKSGKQVAPFLGVDGHFVGSDPNDPNAPFDQEGVSIGEVTQLADSATESNINSLQTEIAQMDKDIDGLDAEIAGQSGEQKSVLVAQKKEAIAKRALLDQTLTDEIVSTIKFTRHSSYQNMDKFVKKLAEN